MSYLIPNHFINFMQEGIQLIYTNLYFIRFHRWIQRGPWWARPPPFRGKNLVGYIGNHWSMTGAGPPLGQSAGPTLGKVLDPPLDSIEITRPCWVENASQINYLFLAYKSSIPLTTENFYHLFIRANCWYPSSIVYYLHSSYL